nr:immunoglobulin light chain junction region [Macaca mulatta]MOW27604.1 immunoglobulin light chain junction region [Macaca mulatta]MOW27912.1 immunoglobulin light chain junction region [Macaca mulatta]MOW27924.1 immunoglobulin light chain junction region [Macaca mulatta]MOW28045.1 immunoglobulin light chain junction region [Macaca mulatta]
DYYCYSRHPSGNHGLF